MIKISRDGATVKFLHSDPITAALKNDGDINMSRASDVKFSNSDKLWYVCLPGTDTRIIPLGFTDRNSAISAEVEILSKFL